MLKRQADVSTSLTSCCSSLIQSCWVLEPTKQFHLPAAPHHPPSSQPQLRCPARRSSSSACPRSGVSFGSSLVGVQWSGIDDSWLSRSSTRTPGRLWSHQSWAEILWNATATHPTPKHIHTRAWFIPPRPVWPLGICQPCQWIAGFGCLKTWKVLKLLNSVINTLLVWFRNIFLLPFAYSSPPPSDHTPASDSFPPLCLHVTPAKKEPRF